MNRLRGELDLSSTAIEVRRLSDQDFNTESLAPGFSAEEIFELLDATRLRDEDAALRERVPESAPPETVEEDEDKIWALTLKFRREADRARVKAVLLEAADGGTTGDGLLAILDDTKDV